MRRVLPVVVLVLLGVVSYSLFLLSNYDTPEPTKIHGGEPANFPQEPKVEVVVPGLLLPDMKIEPPKELYITNTGGTKKIRFDTTFSNVGEGPLELIGEPDMERNVTVATQRVSKIDGTTQDSVIGEFVYHPGHRHWHVDKYGHFALYKYDKNLNPTELVAQTDKFSFCIWDEHPYDLNLPNAPQTRQYARCPRNIQGNSVGWGDTYTANTEGQEIDISAVPDGEYLIKSTVNANNSILESDFSNNKAVLYVEIKGNNLTIIKK